MYFSFLLFIGKKINTSLKNKICFENIYFPSKFIKLCSESLKAFFLNFIENDQFSNALDKIMECLSIAADGMKKSAQVIKNKTHNLSQPWFDEECACFRSKTLNALRSFRVTRLPESLGVYQNLKKTYKNLINQKKDAYTRKQTFKLEQAYDNKTLENFGVS